jgi:hypothetical protein
MKKATNSIAYLIITQWRVMYIHTYVQMVKMRTFSVLFSNNALAGLGLEGPV